MKANVGNIDRALRIILGLALVLGAALGVLPVWAWIGVLPLATGIVRVCPAYLPFGFNTCSTRKPE